MQTTTIPEPQAIISRHTYGWLVEADWTDANVDRPTTRGIVVRTRDQAEALYLAITEGVWYENPTVRRDVDGRTYVQATGRTIGRYAVRELRELGYL